MMNQSEPLELSFLINLGEIRTYTKLHQTNLHSGHITSQIFEVFTGSKAHDEKGHHQGRVV